jgi:hypothetical protein
MSNETNLGTQEHKGQTQKKSSITVLIQSIHFKLYHYSTTKVIKNGCHEQYHH